MSDEITEFIWKLQAVKNLAPNCSFSTDNEGKINWGSGNPLDEPTKEEIDNEIARLKADYDSMQYQRDRKLEYPTIEELVVALYDESDKASIIERRNAVKAKYPKPE